MLYDSGMIVGFVVYVNIFYDGEEDYFFVNFIGCDRCSLSFFVDLSW